MTDQTDNVKAFVKANRRSVVVEGSARQEGGGTYTLSNGKTFSFTLEEARSMPAPRWKI